MIKRIDQDLIQQLIKQATQSPRLRSHLNLHSTLDDPVQRLLISLNRGTYVRPHHHPKEGKWELLLVVHGEVCLVFFDANGKVQEKILLKDSNSALGVEIPTNTWHTVYPSSKDAVILEVKAGPYTPAEPGDFASWSPPEGDAHVERFLQWIEEATPGEHFKHLQ